MPEIQDKINARIVLCKEAKYYARRGYSQEYFMELLSNPEWRFAPFVRELSVRELCSILHVVWE